MSKGLCQLSSHKIYVSPKVWPLLWSQLDFLSVWIFYNFIYYFSKDRWRQWYQMSMCFVRLWQVAFLLIFNAHWLSQCMMYLSRFIPKSRGNLFRQSISLLALVIVIYFAFVVNKGAYLCSCHDIASLSNINKNLDVDFL